MSGTGAKAAHRLSHLTLNHPKRDGTILKMGKLRLKDVLYPTQDLTAKEQQSLILAKPSNSRACVWEPLRETKVKGAGFLTYWHRISRTPL